jgi:hypothetical protein
LNLFNQRLRALCARLMPYAEAQGVFTDEDVFPEALRGALSRRCP